MTQQQPDPAHDDQAVDQTTPFGNPNGDQPAVDMTEPSIIDTILNLDELLSADVRRAEKSARFSTKPWLEAEIEDLDSQLDGLVDGSARPLDEGDERSVAGGGGKAREMAEQIRAMQHEYAASFRTVRVQQMPDEDWGEFEARHKKGIEGDSGSPERTAMFNELIAACAIRPKFTVEQVVAMRKKLGRPAVNEIALAAWNVNTSSGVSIPKSQLSSLVLRRREPGRN